MNVPAGFGSLPKRGQSDGATGLARTVIYSGLYEVEHPGEVPPDRIRKAGGGRKNTTEHNPDFPRRLESLVEPLVRGYPESPPAVDL